MNEVIEAGNAPSFMHLLEEANARLDAVHSQMCHHYCRFNYDAENKMDGLSEEEVDDVNQTLWDNHCSVCPMRMLMRD